MKYYAEIKRATGIELFEIKKINLGIECFEPTEDTINALITEALESKQMQIYKHCLVEKYNGRIDAFGLTPLYTDGQVDVEGIVNENKERVFTFRKALKISEHTAPMWIVTGKQCL